MGVHRRTLGNWNGTWQWIRRKRRAGGDTRISNEFKPNLPIRSDPSTFLTQQPPSYHKYVSRKSKSHDRKQSQIWDRRKHDLVKSNQIITVTVRQTCKPFYSRPRNNCTLHRRNANHNKTATRPRSNMPRCHMRDRSLSGKHKQDNHQSIVEPLHPPSPRVAPSSAHAVQPTRSIQSIQGILSSPAR